MMDALAPPATLSVKQGDGGFGSKSATAWGAYQQSGQPQMQPSNAAGKKPVVQNNNDAMEGVTASPPTPAPSFSQSSGGFSSNSFAGPSTGNQPAAGQTGGQPPLSFINATVAATLAPFMVQNAAP